MFHAVNVYSIVYSSLSVVVDIFLNVVEILNRRTHLNTVREE